MNDSNWQSLVQQPDATMYVVASYGLMGLAFAGLLVATLLRARRIKKKEQQLATWQGKA